MLPYLAYSMIRSRILNFSLIAYLGLFLNLGPSLHRAPCFHFHSVSGVEYAEHCCHCCGPAERATRISGQSNEPSFSIPGGCTDPNCAVCEFFKKYNSTEVSNEIHLCSDRVSSLDLPCPAIFKAVTIVSTARGPPAC